MQRHPWVICVGSFVAIFAVLQIIGTSKEPPGRSPEGLPRIPQPEVRAVQVPKGYRVEVVIANLTYPTSIEFDDAGTMYVAEGGFNYGDDVALARILGLAANGSMEIIAEQLDGPITDLLWHEKRLYISQRGKISMLDSGGVRDLVTGLPSLGDHHNNQLTVGPDGKIYFGQGTATNSGIVGLDNFKAGWLAKSPEVHDVPAKDIRLSGQAFETPDPLTLLAGKRNGQGEGGKSQHASKDHEGHGEAKVPNQGQKHAGHEKGQEPVKVDLSTKGKPAEKAQEHEGHLKSKVPTKANEHKGDSATGQEPQKGKGHEGHVHESHVHPPVTKNQNADIGHEGHGTAKESGKGQASEVHAMTKSFAFQPFGKTPPDDGAVLGTVKANGTILRMNADGSDLEMYAWGLRNPFGLIWGPEGKLYASDNGYDERGSRPIAHAPDCLWVIKQDAWYGFPDYAGGIPVTDTRFAPEHGPVPEFLMRDHPNVEKPVVTLTHHVGAAKIDFSRSEEFGFSGHLFLALSGDMNSITGMHEERSGFEVVRIDPATGEPETFFTAKKDALGPQGMEYVATAGPRRPVDVKFSADGNTLYVVDVGAMAILSTATGPAPRPFPGTGVIWRITREKKSPNRRKE